jgi:hypothetical protein
MDPLQLKREQETHLIIYDFSVEECFPGLKNNSPWKLIDKKYDEDSEIRKVMSLNAFRARIRTLYEDNIPSVAMKLAEIDAQRRKEAIISLTQSLCSLKAYNVTQTNYGKFVYNIFKRIPLVKMGVDEERKLSSREVKLSEYATAYLEEIDSLIRRIESMRDRIETSKATDVESLPSNTMEKTSPGNNTHAFYSGDVTKSRKARARIHTYSSFPYKKYHIDKSNLRDLRTGLQKLDLIPKKVKQREFDQVFSGKKVTNPLQWRGSLNELHYLIDRFNNTEILEKRITNQWEVAALCFILEGNTKIDKNKLRVSHKPPANLAHIDKLIDLL